MLGFARLAVLILALVFSSTVGAEEQKEIRAGIFCKSADLALYLSEQLKEGRFFRVAALLHLQQGRAGVITIADDWFARGHGILYTLDEKRVLRYTVMHTFLIDNVDWCSYALQVIDLEKTVANEEYDVVSILGSIPPIRGYEEYLGISSQQYYISDTRCWNELTLTIECGAEEHAARE